MNSPYLIPNNLKKWQEYDLRAEVFDPKLLHFYMMERNSNSSGLVELATAKPFLVNTEQTKKMVFEYNGDLYAEVSQSLKMMLLLWNDMKDMHKEEYILSEASNFQDLCIENLKQLVVELCGVPMLPLNYRPRPFDEGEFLNEKPKNLDQNDEDEDG